MLATLLHVLHVAACIRAPPSPSLLPPPSPSLFLLLPSLLSLLALSPPSLLFPLLLTALFVNVTLSKSLQFGDKGTPLRQGIVLVC